MHPAVIVGGVSGWILSALLFVLRRITLKEWKNIIKKAEELLEEYNKAVDKGGPGGERILKKEWIRISKKGAELAEAVLEALAD